MKFSFFHRIILIAALGCCFFSCSSDLDFDQADNFSAQPVFTTNLAYYNLDAPDLIENGTEIPAFVYTANVDFLNSSAIKDNLIKSELYFRIKNTITRAFNLNITFLDKNKKPVYSIKMDVPPYDGTEIVVEKTEIFTVANVDILKNTTQMVFSGVMLPGTPITEATPGRVEYSSSITAYFDVK